MLSRSFHDELDTLGDRHHGNADDVVAENSIAGFQFSVEKIGRLFVLNANAIHSNRQAIQMENERVMKFL